MRTTVEITDKQRAELLRLAAMRGEKGFSSLVQEALDDFLKREKDRRRSIRKALKLRGCLNEKEASRLIESVKEGRSRWR